MTSRRKNRPVICTDDAWILFAYDSPPTIEDLKEKVVGAYKDTSAALWWSIGDHEVYNYETQVGEILGEGYEDLDDSSHPYSFVHTSGPGSLKNMAENTRYLIDNHVGPLTALIDLCREVDMEFFPRVRMNSHYHIDPAHPGYGRFRREHPELLIGRPGEEIAEGSIQWGIRTGKNYAFPEVREYMAGIIFELFERFDVDGLELDFYRHPAFFRIEEAYQNRYLMTDLIRHVRDRMNEVGEQRGKHLDLAVRVAATIRDSMRIGLDVAHWMAEGLVDIVVAGGGHVPFETPVDEFVEAARGTGCLVYGCINSGRHLDEKSIRALASRFWGQGASGIYLYNYYTMSPEWNRRVLNQIADPAALRRLDKRYELDVTGAFYPTGGHGSAFRLASPAAQLPVTLDESLAGGGSTLCLEIFDDLEAASAEGSLGTCVLALRLDNLTPDDELDVRLNGETFPWGSAKVSFDGWKRVQLEPRFWMKFPSVPTEATQSGASVEFDVGCPPLGHGTNDLEVGLVTSNSERANRVVLKGVEASINFVNE